jgi:hypothetical protein
MRIVRKSWLTVLIVAVGQFVFPTHASAEPNNFSATKQIVPLGSVITITGNDLINANYFRIQTVRQPPNIFLEFEIPYSEKVSDNEIRLTLPSYEMLVSYAGGLTLDNQYRIRLYRVSNSYTEPYFEIDLYQEDPYSGGNGRIACSTQGYFTVLNYEVISQTSCEGSAVIPEGVTSIGYRAFYQATGIASITISNSVTSIGEDAFYNAYGISTLNIPDSVTTIGQQAFRNTGISDLRIPDSVRTIGDYAFYSSVNLSRVQIGDGVTSFGVGVFDLTNLALTESIPPYPQTVFYCGNELQVKNADYNGKGSGPSCGDPDSPSLDQVQVLSENSVRLTFTAPVFTAAGVVSQYEVAIRDPITLNVLSTQRFTPNPRIERGESSTLTVVGLTAGTTYTFSLQSIKFANSREYGSYQSYSLTATTTASGGGGTGGGGTGGGGTGADELKRQQEAAAAELKRQQEAATAAKQKQDQELKEILSLVPTIAGLAQGIAGLGNSLLSPQTCVKGKVVKKVKAGAKCPKGYKVRK